MSADVFASVVALSIFSLKKRSEGVEAVGATERSDQWVMKESIMMLAICFVPLIFNISDAGISHVGLSPGSIILSVGPFSYFV